MDLPSCHLRPFWRVLILVFLQCLTLPCKGEINVHLVFVSYDAVARGRTNTGWGFENVGSAVHLAIEDYQARGGLSNVVFR